MSDSELNGLNQGLPFRLDDGDTLQRLRDWYAYCQLIPFDSVWPPEANAGRQGKTWADVMFPGGVDTLARLVEQARRPDGQMSPHQAFLLAFLRMLETPQALFNRLAWRHRDLYYRHELQLSERPGEADRVALSFKLDDDAPDRLLPAGLLFDAEQDREGGARHFRLEEALLVNRGIWADLRWCVVPSQARTSGVSRTVFDIDADPADPVANWPVGGLRLFESGEPRERPQRGIVSGRVVADPKLALSGGTRKIGVIFAAPLDPGQLIAWASGDGIWLPLSNAAADGRAQDRQMRSQEAMFVLGPQAAAVQGSPGLDGFAATLPLLKVTHASAEPVPRITGLLVSVERLPEVSLSTDDGVAQINQRFHPFGLTPVVGSGFQLMARDWCNKPGCTISLSLYPEWLGLPEQSFDKWYASYGDEAPSNQAFRLMSWIEPAEERPQGSARALFAEGKDQAGGVPRGTVLKHCFQSPLMPVSDSVDPRDWQQRLRFDLSGSDFRHMEYRSLFASASATRALNPPYTPEFKSLRVDYRILEEGPPIAAQYVLTPFGHRQEPEDGSGGGAQADNNGKEYMHEFQLYLGFKQVEPGQNLDLHWQIKASQAQTVSWQYLGPANRWRSLDAGVREHTASLHRSGLWSTVWPADAVRDATVMPTGKYWIRALIDPASTRQARDQNEFSPFPWLYSIHTNSQIARRVQEGSRDDFPLPAETITRPLDPVGGLCEVKQPWPSEGGRAPESEAEFHKRVAQRLNHRNRALTCADIKALLLERFPEIHEIRVAPPHREAQRSIQRMIVVPAPGQQDNADRLRPKFSPMRLDEMRETVLERASIWLDLELLSPDYRNIALDAQLELNPRFSVDYARREAIQALSERYMPWSSGGHASSLGNSIDYYEVLACLQQLPFVERVADLRLDKGRESIKAADLEVLTLDFSKCFPNCAAADASRNGVLP